jgi:K+-transporting ATPase KdpF subunit
MMRVAFRRRPRNSDRVAWREAKDYVGYRLCRRKHVVLRYCDRICNRMRPIGREGDAAMIELMALGFVTVALLVYLVYALLRPEKF